MSHFDIIFSLCIFISTTATFAYGYGNGRWNILQKSIGISAMHMQLLNDDRVVIFDRTDFGKSNLSLARGVRCRRVPSDPDLQYDCSAHSVEYDTLSNTFRPLTVLTDTWCSSGATAPDGTLYQTGGYNDGVKVVRTFQPFCKSCDWVEYPNTLLDFRWYATNHALPDGRTIIIGGRKSFSYEFYPKSTPSFSKLYNLPFLKQTNDPLEENNLYPFVFLHVDGNLFIFANNQAILFDYNKNVVVRTYPSIPGGDPRNYPSTGSAVLLPLKNLELGLNMEAEVLICGGAPSGSYEKALTSGTFLPALNTCARIRISDPKPAWEIETMPIRRVMGDMVTLPNGDVILINGARSGSAGWELGRNGILNPVIYHPDNAPGYRFVVQKPTKIPRMYHSCAILIRDGRVIVGGSNPHSSYNFSGVLYPTDLSLEAFSPTYLDSTKNELRPIITTPNSGKKVLYGKEMKIEFSISGLSYHGPVKVTMLRPPFNTHSFSQSQRLLVLTNITPPKAINPGKFEVQVMTPESANIAPPGYYMMFVVHMDIPSVGIWVQIT